VIYYYNVNSAVSKFNYCYLEKVNVIKTVKVRKIIHIDMDAFYASIEQRDNPSYRKKPLAVGSKSERGVIAAASYEARKYGVRSAMSSVVAIKKCPELLFVPPRISYYKEVSKKIMTIFQEYTDCIEPLSLDEAFLDVTENKKDIPSATIIAQAIKKQIKEELSLVASAGVSYNKFLAKVASDVNKPDGLFVIPPKDAIGFIERLPIERFFGVGKVGAKKMHSLGIRNGKDLKEKELLFLINNFGKAGKYFYDISRGIDERPVVVNRQRKSIGAERTFSKDVIHIQDVFEKLEDVLNEAFARMQKANKYGKTITIKIKYHDFEQITRSKSFQNPISDIELLKQAVIQILKQIDSWEKPIRLIGITASNLS